MFSRRRLDRMESLQQSIHDQLATIVTALIVSEPRTGKAAEAFDGLRKSVNVAARHRWQHLTQLLSYVDAIERGATIETLKARCEEWCLQAGLQRYTDIGANPDWFDIVEGEGREVELIDPAWVDVNAGQVINRGTVRRVAGAHTADVAETGTAEETVPFEKPGNAEGPTASEARLDSAEASVEEPTIEGESTAVADEPAPADESATADKSTPDEKPAVADSSRPEEATAEKSTKPGGDADSTEEKQ